MSAERLAEMCFGLSRRRRSLVGCQFELIKEVGGCIQRRIEGIGRHAVRPGDIAIVDGDECGSAGCCKVGFSITTG